MINFEKVKCAIEVSIYHVGGIAVGEESRVHWTRGKNSISSKKQPLVNKLSKFTDKFKMNSSLLMNSKRQIKPDLNTIAVLIDEREIGIVRFDMGKFYEAGKVETIRATMSSRRAIEDS